MYLDLVSKSKRKPKRKQKDSPEEFEDLSSRELMNQHSDIFNVNYKIYSRLT